MPYSPLNISKTYAVWMIVPTMKLPNNGCESETSETVLLGRQEAI